MFGRRPSGELVVVGLGNPGPAYARTRHNAGTMLVERLASELGVSLGRARGQARVAQADLEGRSAVLAVPTTFMNLSGPPVAKLARKSGGPSSLVVCYDELDLPFARLRFKDGGGTNGHNGLESVCASLRTKDFLRLRIGIGRPPEGVDPAKFVLQPFRPDERDALDEALGRGIQGLRVLAREGLDRAQNVLHAPD